MRALHWVLAALAVGCSGFSTASERRVEGITEVFMRSTDSWIVMVRTENGAEVPRDISLLGHETCAHLRPAQEPVRFVRDVPEGEPMWAAVDRCKTEYPRWRMYEHAVTFHVRSDTVVQGNGPVLIVP